MPYADGYEVVICDSAAASKTIHGAASCCTHLDDKIAKIYLSLQVAPEVSYLCHGGVPGREDGVDLLVSGLSWATARKSCRDQGPAQLDEHVLEGGLCLGAVPGLRGPAVVDGCGSSGVS